MVDPASDFLMSSLAEAMMPPNSSVTVPTMATAIRASGASARIGLDRTSRYTPAVTMVAAWISADTGVGPSIASSSQDCSGTWADFPHAPSSSSSPSAVATPLPPECTEPNTPVNEVVPNSLNIRKMARVRLASPTRLTMNAFFAATAAEGLSCQNPISR